MSNEEAIEKVETLRWDIIDFEDNGTFNNPFLTAKALIQMMDTVREVLEYVVREVEDKNG